MNLRLGSTFILHSPEGVVPDDQLDRDVRQAVDLLIQLNRLGCRYMVADGKLLVSGAKHLEGELRTHRDTIISLLNPPPKEPCRGGCGKLMPAGQACPGCALRMAAKASALAHAKAGEFDGVRECARRVR